MLLAITLLLTLSVFRGAQGGKKTSSVLSLNHKRFTGKRVSLVIAPVFVLISSRRLPGSAGFTITFMLPARDSNGSSLSAGCTSPGEIQDICFTPVPVVRLRPGCVCTGIKACLGASARWWGEPESEDA